MGHPISSPKKMDKFYLDPGKGVGGLRVMETWWISALVDGRAPFLDVRVKV